MVWQAIWKQINKLLLLLYAWWLENKEIVTCHLQCLAYVEVYWQVTWRVQNIRVKEENCHLAPFADEIEKDLINGRAW